MIFLKTLLLTTILSISASALETDCPTGWLPNTFHVTKCCSGHMVIDGQGAYCCVSDMRAFKELLTNTAKRYATPTTTEETNWSTVENSCVATVRFTASDYSAQVSSASTKAEATPTDTSTSELTSSSTTDSGASSGTRSKTSTPTPTASPTATPTAASTATSTPTSTLTSTPTSNVAMSLATAKDVVLGGAGFAAALFVL